LSANDQSMDQKVDWAARVDVLQGTFAEHTV
jgi:hypothetical protein